MGKDFHLFVFIDALGWEVIKDKGFLEDLLPYRHRVKMQFGYSSTAIPTILTGQPPTVHKHLSFYYYAPHLSPFKLLQLLMLERMPNVFDRWRVRHILSKIIAHLKGYTGYFEMYAMPFNRLRYFDYIEKNDIFVPGGLAPVPNLADQLVARRIPYHISNWRLSETQNVDSLLADIDKGEIRFGFLYTAAMDGLLHMVTKDGVEIPLKLDWYARRLRAIVKAIKSRYDDFTISVMSDHGMTTLAGVVDVKKIIESLGLVFGQDYAAVYDSTMARIWYLNNTARESIGLVLPQIPHAKVLLEGDKRRYGIDFPDHMYGETILLMDPGWQIEPCDMGRKALPGMHGFAPEHEDSYASFLSSVPLAIPPQWVGDYFRVMVDRMGKVATP